LVFFRAVIAVHGIFSAGIRLIASKTLLVSPTTGTRHVAFLKGTDGPIIRVYGAVYAKITVFAASIGLKPWHTHICFSTATITLSL
jgi:hypothetical protein